MSSGVRRTIGIDLGTTNSCVATIIGGRPQVIPNAHGYKTTPSVVAFNDDDKLLVGQHAKRQMTMNPTRTVSSAKRLIGRRFESLEVRKARNLYSYGITPGSSNNVVIQAAERNLSLAEVGALIVSELRDIASEFLGDQVHDAVITVPAHFSDSQRQATKRAGQLAGLNVLRIINEPTAAALAYGFGRRKNARVVIYDLGGGTFDVSILEIRNGVFKVLATGGDTFLGGEDFDNRIIDFLARRFLKESGIDLRRDVSALQRLRDAVESMKCDLSMVKEAEIVLPCITHGKDGPLNLEQRFTRGDLDRLCGDLVDGTLQVCSNVLREAGLGTDDIDDVILVGGQTRMPKIHDEVSNHFGRSVSKQVHPDEAVAIGAAIHADALVNNSEDLLLLDVTPMSLGIKIAGGMYQLIVPRYSTVPTTRKHIFTTVTDNQHSVRIEIIQGNFRSGEKVSADTGELLGTLVLSDIPPQRAGEPEIEVSFHIDANGILGVRASDLDSGKEHAIRIVAGQALADEPDGESEREAFENQLDQQASQNKTDEELRIAIYRLRTGFELSHDRLSKDDRRRVTQLLESAPTVLRGEEQTLRTQLLREVKKMLQLVAKR